MGTAGIIIAAGMGRRLLPYTRHQPKTNLPLFGKPLITHILDHFSQCAIEKVALVTGYQAQQLAHLRAEKIHNPNFRTTNILHSLMQAKMFMSQCVEKKQNLVVSYADIYFQPQVLSTLLQSNSTYAVVVDSAWHNLYLNRPDNPASAGEIALYAANQLQRIGVGITPEKHWQHGEFIGLMHMTPRGIQLWLELFAHIDASFQDDTVSPEAKKWRNAYLSDFLQIMMQNGNDIECITIRNGWLELDTVGDYERALSYNSLDELEEQYSTYSDQLNPSLCLPRR